MNDRSSQIVQAITKDFAGPVSRADSRRDGLASLHIRAAWALKVGTRSSAAT
jgi:hypothetical protein